MGIERITFPKNTVFTGVEDPGTVAELAIRKGKVRIEKCDPGVGDITPVELLGDDIRYRLLVDPEGRATVTCLRKSNLTEIVSLSTEDHAKGVIIMFEVREGLARIDQLIRKSSPKKSIFKRRK